MPYVQTTHSQIQRDTESKGLVAIDRAELLKSRVSRKNAKRMLTTQEDIDARIASMTSRLDRCETLLQELIRHVVTLVEKPASTENNTEPSVQE